MNISGVVDAILVSIPFGVWYLASGRKLWLPVTTHGAGNTTG